MFNLKLLLLGTIVFICLPSVHAASKVDAAFDRLKSEMQRESETKKRLVLIEKFISQVRLEIKKNETTAEKDDPRPDLIAKRIDLYELESYFDVIDFRNFSKGRCREIRNSIKLGYSGVGTDPEEAPPPGARRLFDIVDILCDEKPQT